MAEMLSSINSPTDLKNLDPRELTALADEIRAYIREFTSHTGGHIGSGLGVVELTIALHYLFEFKEQDDLILDVGHQCYPHKILTGRRDEMYSIRQRAGLSGFPDPKESPFDRVKTGHGGTSLTTALGMAVGRKQSGDTEGRVVAMIGDGALQEGSALEALNHAGSFKDLPLTIVFNDNNMGISPAVGALSTFFSRLRTAKAYRTTSRNVRHAIDRIEEDAPRIAKFARDVLDHVRAGMHGLMPQVNPGTFFEALGFFYYGPVDGHDIPTILESLQNCSKLNRPVVLHAITEKGKGYAEEPDRLCYHAGKPAKKVTAHLPKEFSVQGGPAYTNIFTEEALEIMREDESVFALTPAMLEGSGLMPLLKEFPERVHDVGMAEQHCVGMAQGLALSGRKVFCAVYSTFMQRAIDQIFQEVALINAPVVFALDRAGVVGPDGATHNGVFDITFCRMFPNMAVMAPRDATELRAMMRLAIAHPGPTAIRYPRTSTPKQSDERAAREFAMGEAELLEDGRDGCLLAYGALVYPALDVAAEIEHKHGKRLAVVNARFAKPLDERTLKREFGRQPVIFTLEDHVVAGGFGSAVAEHAVQHGLEASKLELIGIDDHWVDHGQRIEALAMAGLDVPSLITRVEARLGLDASIEPSAESSDARVEA